MRSSSFRRSRHSYLIELAVLGRDLIRLQSIAVSLGSNLVAPTKLQVLHVLIATLHAPCRLLPQLLLRHGTLLAARCDLVATLGGHSRGHLVQAVVLLTVV